MPSAAVNGTTVDYEVVGQGPTCLVLAGWPGVDSTYLRPGLDRLGRLLRLVYFDHRPEFSVEQAADDAASLAQAVAGGPVVVLGHYQGGSVALETALRHPDQVAGLILVGASPGELGTSESLADAFDAPPTPPEVDVVQRVPPGSDEEVAASMLVLQRFFFHRLGHAESEDVFAGCTYSAATAVHAMMSLGWWSAVDRLARLASPVLLLVGRHDVFAGPFQSERIVRALPGATLAVLEESGHLPWVEEPDAFEAAVERWLAGNGLLGAPVPGPGPD
jgi:proline iminopeptidase